MKTKRLLFFALICAFLLASCASASRSATGVADSKSARSSAVAEAPAAVPFASAQSLDASAAAGNTASNGAAVDATTSESSQQMIIQTASLTLVVDDPSQALENIMKMATELGGYTVSSNSYQTTTSAGTQVPEANVTIRVPAEKLNTALSQIETLTGDPKQFVTSVSVTGTDITQQYTDLQSRLSSLEEASKELSTLYDKATNTDDILAIYNQKLQLDEQIEVLKGQIKYDEEASAKSAISVQINAKAASQPITVAGWQPKGIARDAVQALLNFFRGLVNFLIWLGIFVLPIAIVIGLPLYFLVRWLVRRSKARKQAPPLPIEKN